MGTGSLQEGQIMKSPSRPPSPHLPTSSGTVIFHPPTHPSQPPWVTAIPSLALSSLTGREVLTPFPGLGTVTAPAHGGAHLKQCDLLKLSRRQKQLCRREPGLAETLQDAAHLSLLECQFQFRLERWNCSLEGRTGLLKRGGEEGWEEQGQEEEGGEGEGWEGRPLFPHPWPRYLGHTALAQSQVRGVLGVNEVQRFPQFLGVEEQGGHSKRGGTAHPRGGCR